MPPSLPPRSFRSRRPHRPAGPWADHPPYSLGPLRSHAAGRGSLHSQTMQQTPRTMLPPAKSDGHLPLLARHRDSAVRSSSLESLSSHADMFASSADRPSVPGGVSPLRDRHSVERGEGNREGRRSCPLRNIPGLRNRRNSPKSRASVNRYNGRFHSEGGRPSLRFSGHPSSSRMPAQDGSVSPDADRTAFRRAPPRSNKETWLTEGRIPPRDRRPPE